MLLLHGEGLSDVSVHIDKFCDYRLEEDCCICNILFGLVSMKKEYLDS